MCYLSGDMALATQAPMSGQGCAHLAQPVFALTSLPNERVSLGQLQLTMRWKMGHGQLGKSVGSSPEQLMVPNSLQPNHAKSLSWNLEN